VLICSAATKGGETTCHFTSTSYVLGEFTPWDRLLTCACLVSFRLSSMATMVRALAPVIKQAGLLWLPNSSSKAGIYPIPQILVDSVAFGLVPCSVCRITRTAVSSVESFEASEVHGVKETIAGFLQFSWGTIAAVLPMKLTATSSRSSRKGEQVYSFFTVRVPGTMNSLGLSTNQVPSVDVSSLVQELPVLLRRAHFPVLHPGTSCHCLLENVSVWLF
jgi:hypothetical protein